MITQSQYTQMLARTATKMVVRGQGVDKESDLHNDILDYCRAKGWLAIHSRMDMRSTNTVGTPDFIILLPGGKTLLVECKAKAGKLSIEQRSLHAWAAKLGHVVYVVWSLDGFVAVTKP